MSRILLLSCNSTQDPYPVYPLGMGMVAGALQNAGHQVKQLDLLCHDEEHISNWIETNRPDCIGLSVRNIDNVDSFTAGSGFYLPAVKELVEKLRHLSQVPIILGGPGFSIMPWEILQYTGADYGVRGAGETATPWLIDLLEQGKPPSKKVIEAGGVDIGIERSGPTSWDREIVRFYNNKSGLLNIQTKRGCNFNCAYCTYPNIDHQGCQPREYSGIIQELWELKLRYGVNEVVFSDSVFNDTHGYYLEFAEELIRSGIDLKWSAFFRPSKTTTDEIRILKRAGLASIELGTDGASDTVLKGLNKDFTFSTVYAFNQVCQKEQIPCAHYVMFGGPGETADTMAEGISNLARLEQCVVFPFFGIRLYPYTRLYNLALAQGVISREDSLLEPVYYHSPELDLTLAKATLALAFGKCKNIIYPPEDGMVRMRILRKMGYKGLLWPTMLHFN
jgi:lipid biosynthesis B12-binding/radical SAM protein